MKYNDFIVFRLTKPNIAACDTAKTPLVFCVVTHCNIFVAISTVQYCQPLYISIPAVLKMSKRA